MGGTVVVVTGVVVVVVVVAVVVGVTGSVVKVGEPTSSRGDSEGGVVVNVPAACERTVNVPAACERTWWSAPGAWA